MVCLQSSNSGGSCSSEGRRNQANSNYPSEFLLDNLKIQTNLIETAWKTGVRRFYFLVAVVFIQSSQTNLFQEEALLTGPLEPTNESYAIAKIAGIKLCEALRRQHGFDAISLMPTNLYSPGDNYHAIDSHVLPALIRRFHEAVEMNLSSVTCWGWSTQREFLHVDDLGEACVFVLKNWKPALNELNYLNVGSGIDLSIRKLAALIAAATGYQGEIIWDHTKPDGTPKKQLDVYKLTSLGWKPRISLDEGISSTVAHFRSELHTRKVRL